MTVHQWGAATLAPLGRDFTSNGGHWLAQPKIWPPPVAKSKEGRKYLTVVRRELWPFWNLWLNLRRQLIVIHQCLCVLSEISLLQKNLAPALQGWQWWRSWGGQQSAKHTQTHTRASSLLTGDTDLYYKQTISKHFFHPALVLRWHFISSFINALIHVFLYVCFKYFISCPWVSPCVIIWPAVIPNEPSFLWICSLSPSLTAPNHSTTFESVLLKSSNARIPNLPPWLLLCNICGPYLLLITFVGNLSWQIGFQSSSCLRASLSTPLRLCPYWHHY